MHVLRELESIGNAASPEVCVLELCTWRGGQLGVVTVTAKRHKHRHQIRRKMQALPTAGV